MKAYDRVSRPVIYKILGRRGCQSKFLQLIKVFHDETRAQVKYKGLLSEYFLLKVGLKLGGVLSGLLWALYMTAIMEEVHKRFNDKGLLGVRLK